MGAPQFSPVTPEFITRLQSLVGEANVSTRQADIDLHAHDESHWPAHPAEVVAWARNAQQVAEVLRLANEARVPVTPWGAGTSLEGNSIPLQGGLVLSLEQMNEIVKVHADDFQVTVQPGLGYKDLNEKLRRYGLFFPPDPGANASIGGMLANNAAGSRTVKYGATKDNVLRIQVALADGRLIEAGCRSVKQSSGYDLLHLFVGSEGTLGVITEATLKLWPIAEFSSAAIATFDDTESAVETVVAVRGSGLEPAALEYIGRDNVRLMNTIEGLYFGENIALLMELSAAHQQTLLDGLATLEEICKEMGATSFRGTTDTAERKAIWEARHGSLEILRRHNPDTRFMSVDVSVPISAYPELVLHIEGVLQEFGGIPGYLVGHAGDGNMHMGLSYRDDASYEVARKINERVVHKAIELDGTSTGEHGVGYGKRKYMQREHGESLDVMRTIKQTLDPNGILNPGKVLPDAE
ncbi:MAG: FAD-binding oxidoreductase [Anaerolineae bacterium]|nr:FAD-binding oxidoreductase [Anaerolineae bacterium]